MAKLVGKSYLLADVLGAKVLNREKEIGRLSDLVIIDGDLTAEVSHLYVGRRFGNPPLIIPWDRIKTFDNQKITVDIESPDKYVMANDYEPLLLKDDILDKKVLDTEGKDVDVVYDIKLTTVGKKLCVTDVDIGRHAFLRRMGLKWLADFLYSLADKVKHETVPWSYVQALPSQISGFSGDLRLKVLKEKLSEMHPVDLADVLEQMEPDQAAVVFNELETTLASDALEEIDPGAQKLILSSLSTEKIAELVDEMTPGQAADVLAVLPTSEMRDVLTLMDNEYANKIEAILEKHEEKILNYATTNFLKFSPDSTVRQTFEQYRHAAKDSDVVMYFYVVDEQDKLLGIIDIRELLKANDSSLLKDIMVPLVASLNPASTLREASTMFSRYGFRAIPVIDDNGRMLGVVAYRDMLNLKHRFLE